jgi:hypothetical protein
MIACSGNKNREKEDSSVCFCDQKKRAFTRAPADRSSFIEVYFGISPLGLRYTIAAQNPRRAKQEQNNRKVTRL